MPEFYRFFDSTVDDEREYTADDFAEYFRTVLTDGIFNGGTNLKVSADGTNMDLNIADGYAWLQGYMYKVDGGHKLTVDTADPSLNRIDRVILRLDKTLEQRNIKAIILKGTPAASPVVPTLTRDENIFDISLAQISVTAGKSFIEGAQITDERLNTSVCGLVNSLIQADTTEIFNQFQAWYNSKTAEFQQEWDDWFTLTTDKHEIELATWFGGVQNEWETWFSAQQQVGYILESDRNQPGGFAGLDENNQVPLNLLGNVKIPTFPMGSGESMISYSSIPALGTQIRTIILPDDYEEIDVYVSNSDFLNVYAHIKIVKNMDVFGNVASYQNNLYNLTHFATRGIYIAQAGNVRIENVTYSNGVISFHGYNQYSGGVASASFSAFWRGKF